MFENWETTQKYESLACDTTIEPAPIAMTVSEGSRPRVASMGASMLAVVTMATVEEPWAVLRAAEMRKGRNIPRFKPPKFVSMKSTIGPPLMIWPKDPPAAVMTRILAESLIPCPTQPLRASLNPPCLMRRRELRTPRTRAVTGSPMKERRDWNRPPPKGFEGNSAIDLRRIKAIGKYDGQE